MRTVCGIDLGTRSCKLVLYDPDARVVVAQTQAPLDLVSRDDGTREQDASWYEDAVAACFAALGADLRGSVAGIGVSGQQHGFVPLDESGKPLHPVKLWCDTSTIEECRELTRAAGGEAALLAGTGMPMLPGYTAPKILWLKNRRPELFARLAHVLLPHDYINFMLSGAYVAECGDASGTALFDVRRRVWSDEVCALVDPGLRDRMPRLIGPAEPAGRTCAAAARRFDIPEGVPVSAGGGDNMMAAVGTGTVRDGFLAMSLGTSGTLFGHSDTPVIDPSGNLAAFCSSTGGWLPLLCTMNCTVAAERFRELLGMDLAAFTAAAAGAPPGAEGVVVLPYFNGERVPDLPRARASLSGLTASNCSPANIARASLESAVFGMRAGLDAFRSRGFEAREIRLAGGGARSPLWRRIAADIMQLPVRVPESDEAAAMGAALQAFYCLETLAGRSTSIEAICDDHVRMEGETVDPDPGTLRAYAEAKAVRDEHLGALAPLYT